MDDPVPRLIRELRGETCPRSVRDRVARRIARDAASAACRPRRPVFAWGLVAALVVAVLVASAILLRPPRLPVPDHHRAEASSAAPTPSDPDRTRVVEQTQVALALVGRFLIDAGVRAENAVLDEALPPLLRSLHSAQTKLIRPL